MTLLFRNSGSDYPCSQCSSDPDRAPLGPSMLRRSWKRMNKSSPDMQIVSDPQTRICRLGSRSIWRDSTIACHKHTRLRRTLNTNPELERRQFGAIRPLPVSPCNIAHAALGAGINPRMISPTTLKRMRPYGPSAPVFGITKRMYAASTIQRIGP